MNFGSSTPWSLGVEEELYLVDPVTLDTAPVFDHGVGSPPRLKPELFAALVETTTPICRDAGEVLGELGRLRAQASARAAAAGASVVAIATHPLARGQGQPIVNEPRYKKMVAELGDAVYRQFVCGLHVHVGVPSREASLRALEGLLPWLPTAISLAANSPFVEGEDSGLRSVRISRLAELPSGGPSATRSTGMSTVASGTTPRGRRRIPDGSQRSAVSPSRRHARSAAGRSSRSCSSAVRRRSGSLSSAPPPRSGMRSSDP